MHDPDYYQVRVNGYARHSCEGFDQLLQVLEEIWKDYGVDSNLSVDRVSGAPEMVVVPKLSYKLLGAPSICVEAGKLYGAVHARNQPEWQEEKKIFVTTDDAGNSIMLEQDDYYVVANINNQ